MLGYPVQLYVHDTPVQPPFNDLALNKRKIFPTCRVHSFFVSATMRYVLPIIAINMLTINSAPRIINRKNMIYDKTKNNNKNS